MRVTGRLFKPSMVPALLDGRKTQTRRIIKPQPDEDGLAKVIDGPWVDTSGREYACPWGEPGDLVYVRENWQSHTGPMGESIIYGYQATDDDQLGPWRPSIHMPRCASRLTLHITDVRVERLQDISEADAIAEGITCEKVIVYAHCNGGYHQEEIADRFFFDDCDDKGFGTGNDAYAALWEKINGAGSLDANPWVWVIDFSVIKQNVDAYLKTLEAA